MHERRSIRLQGYNYTQPGYYFVTICAHDRECIFGKIVDGQMILNEYGKIVETEWMRTAQMRANVNLDEHVIMPNHLHGIIVITDAGRGALQRAPTNRYQDSRRGTLQRAPRVEQFGKPVSNSIPTIVRLFKSTVTKQINELRKTPLAPVWQRNYYEHIIRNEDSLNRIREYIIHNPLRWMYDRENPDGIPDDAEKKFWNL